MSEARDETAYKGPAAHGVSKPTTLPSPPPVAAGKDEDAILIELVAWLERARDVDRQRKRKYGKDWHKERAMGRIDMASRVLHWIKNHQKEEAV